VFRALALIALASGINLIALLLVPLYLWFIVRTHHGVARVLWECCWRACVVLLIVVALYVPFWRGGSTFLAITQAMDMQHLMYSLLDTLAAPLRWLYNLILQSANVHISLLQPTDAANATILSCSMFI